MFVLSIRRLSKYFTELIKIFKCVKCNFIRQLCFVHLNFVEQYFKFVLYSLFEEKILITKIFVRRHNELRRYFSFLRRCCTLHIVYDIIFAPSPKNVLKKNIFIENIIILLINWTLTSKNISRYKLSVGDIGCDIKMSWFSYRFLKKLSNIMQWNFFINK